MKKFNKEDIDNIIELSKKLKQKEIAEIYNISQSTIGKILKKNGVNTQKSRLNLSWLKLDFEYFDSIDSCEKAYWLGFISADGCLKDNKLRVTSKDIEILEKLKKDLKSEHKITINKTFDKRTKKEYISYILQITSKAFTDKLSKYIPIDKSNSFVIPEIDEKFYPEFLAGIIDGDGSFSLKKDRSIAVNLISTKECLQEIQNYLLKKLNINKTTLQPVTKNKKNVWKLYIYAGSFDFLNLIYRNENKKMYLKRKQEKLYKIINYKK